MRVFTLVRIACADTDWQPQFALRKTERRLLGPVDMLVRGPDNALLSWGTARGAFDYVAKYHPAAAVVWEGTTY